MRANRRALPAAAGVVALLGLLQAWDFRFEMNPDGISYLDMAEAFLRDGYSGLVNGYWSPLYPRSADIARARVGVFARPHRELGSVCPLPRVLCFPSPGMGHWCGSIPREALGRNC